MSLSYAILASLTESRCSGYDLAKRFDTSVGFFWSATHQQIYKELRKLEELGWIEAEEVLQEGRPDKKVFSITHKGEESLREWIVQPSSISPTKEEILVKLFAGHLVPKETILQQLQAQCHLHEEQLNVYRAIEAKYFQDISNCDTATKFQYLTLLRGIRIEEDWISWCNEVINLI
jgi:DNA-binding PadR family transcriptional regulator